MVSQRATNIKTANILLVEDNVHDIELMIEAFKQLKLKNKIYTVKNGEDALAYILGYDKFSDRNQYPLPDIIILDLNLPKLNGLDVLKKIKSTDGIKRIPVIMLTSSDYDTDRINAYDSGVNSYIIKPFCFERFVDVCKSIRDYWETINKEPPQININ